VVIPSPIGNLGDLSLRQYEALTKCDILACEDTRKTGKLIGNDLSKCLIELILKKKLREQFKTDFGVSMEDFMQEEMSQTQIVKDIERFAET